MLEEDGTVRVPSRTGTVGKLMSDGRFLSPSGSLIAELEPAGEIIVRGQRRMPVTIDAEGAIHSAQGTLQFGQDGLLRGGSPDAPETRITGSTVETRRTAAFLLILASFPARP